MAFESLKAEIDILLAEMINQPEDIRELQEQLREKLNAMRAMGMPLPDDLVDLQRRIEQDLGEASA